MTTEDINLTVTVTTSDGKSTAHVYGLPPLEATVDEMRKRINAVIKPILDGLMSNSFAKLESPSTIYRSMAIIRITFDVPPPMREQVKESIGFRLPVATGE